MDTNNFIEFIKSVDFFDCIDYIFENEKSNLIISVGEFALSHEKKSRFEHSVRVANTARELCKKYGIIEERGFLAGLAHDICKDFSSDDLLEIVQKSAWQITEIEKNNLSLLHGKAASVKLQKDFCVTDQEVLDAVAYHTCGAPKMCDLAKIIFVADKIEPARPQVTAEYLAHFEKMTLDEMALYVMQENIDFQKKHDKQIAKESVEFVHDLEKQGVKDFWRKQNDK